MKASKVISIIFVLCLAIKAGAQTTNPEKQVVLNQKDKAGNPQGMWLIKQIAALGEPGLTQFGAYDHGQKMGTWYKVDENNDLVAIENYKYNVLDGEVKYFERGQLTCIGHYRGLNPANKYDTIVVVDPVSGLESYAYPATDRGTLRHGLWRFYDPENGRMIKEEDYQVDNLLYEKDFTLSKADSLYYEHRNKNLPHTKSVLYKPPVKKQFSYLTY